MIHLILLGVYRFLLKKEFEPISFSSFKDIIKQLKPTMSPYDIIHNHLILSPII